ncbi:unnamed protein product [Brassica oleracea]
MLEQFGAVGDANVFYWFQNRRSRSLRRQRQLQAATAAAVTSRGAEDQQHMTTMSMHHPYSNNEINLGFGSCSNSSANYFFNDRSSQVSSFLLGHSSSSSNDGCESNSGMENLFTMYGHESDHPHLHQHNPNDATNSNPSDQNSSSHYQQGLMTVFVNGVPMEVTEGALIDMKAMFGEDLALMHSSGLPLPIDEFGLLMHSLHHGQSYFLVTQFTSLLII